jgi:hypothetical protein
VISIARSFRLELGVTRETGKLAEVPGCVRCTMACHGTLLWRARQSGVTLVLLGLKDGGFVVSVVGE